MVLTIRGDKFSSIKSVGFTIFRTKKKYSNSEIKLNISLSYHGGMNSTCWILIQLLEKVTYFTHKMSRRIKRKFSI